MNTFKVVVEKHSDCYVAYPLGIQGAVVGQGTTYDEALADVASAIRFHVETFGLDEIEHNGEPIEAFIAEAQVDLHAVVSG